MNEQAFFNSLIIGWFLLAVVIFLALLFFAAPYGRHFRRGWGPAINNKVGWVIMEAAAPLVFAVCFVLGSNANTVTTLVFLGLWEAHYIHRAFIYPFSLRSRSRGMPLTVVGFGLLFNTVNGYLNGRYIFTFSTGYTNEWLGDPRFIAGVITLYHRFHYQPAGGPDSPAVCANLVNPVTRFPMAGFTAGYPALITLVRSSSGLAGL